MNWIIEFVRERENNKTKEKASRWIQSQRFFVRERD